VIHSKLNHAEVSEAKSGELLTILGSTTSLEISLVPVYINSMNKHDLLKIYIQT